MCQNSSPQQRPKRLLAPSRSKELYQLATPTTETVPISEPITNAAGPITIAAENTVDVTYNKSLAKAFEQITAAIASLGTV